MFNIFSPTLETEIKKSISDLNRRITSAELNLITLESHLHELYEKQTYLKDRLLQLANAEPSHDATSGTLPTKCASASREFVTPNGTALE